MRTTAEEQRPAGTARAPGGAVRRRPAATADSESGSRGAIAAASGRAGPDRRRGDPAGAGRRGALRVARRRDRRHAGRHRRVDGAAGACLGAVCRGRQRGRDRRLVSAARALARQGGRHGDPALAGGGRLCDRHRVRRAPGSRPANCRSTCGASTRSAAGAEAPGVLVEASGRAAALTGTRDIPTEILLHIERAGDRLFPGRGWVGALGRKMRIEAFSIRPLEQSGAGRHRDEGLSARGRRDAVGPGRRVVRHPRPRPAADRFRGPGRAAPGRPVRRAVSGLVLCRRHFRDAPQRRSVPRD